MLASLLTTQNRSRSDSWAARLALVMGIALVPPSCQGQLAESGNTAEALCAFGKLCFGDEPPQTELKQAEVKALPPPAPISAYKDNYFDLALKRLGGDHPAPWVFKLGIKTPLLVGEHSGNGAYFAYRMTGYWDIDATSAPFRDINHNPSIFWLHDNHDAQQWMRGFEAGIEHISNGQDNTSTGPNGTGVARSRAIGVAAFFEPRLQWPAWGWTYQPRLWIPRNTGENSAIRSEWGLLWNTLSYQDLVELSTKGNPFHRGQAAIKLHYSLANLISTRSHDRDTSALKLSLTIFNGYGDGLLEYQARRTWARIGLTFSPYAN